MSVHNCADCRDREASQWRERWAGLALLFAAGLAIAVGCGSSRPPPAPVGDSGWTLAHVNPGFDAGAGPLR